MIIKCSSVSEAKRIIETIKNQFRKYIFNYTINEAFDSIYLIIDGNIEALSKDYLNSIYAQCVFSSLDEDLYFVINKDFPVKMRIGNRIYQPNDGMISVIAGPCEIESYKDLYETASLLKSSGVSIFRAMPRKPRTSPYNFQGVGDIGWEYLYKIKEQLGLPVLAEVFSQDEIDLACKYGIDIIQIGSRNMQNYDLIKRAAKSHITTVLKKGMWCNNTQLLKAAEYFFVYGNGNVILAERGIQTHESSTRNTLDLSSILFLKGISSLPVMADASHGTGVKNMVIPMNCAAIMVGADIIEVEVHVNPNNTIKPGDFYQMLDISQYNEMIGKMTKLMKSLEKRFDFIQ